MNDDTMIEYELQNEPGDATPRPGFRAELRDNLSRQWNGEPPLPTVRQLDERPPRRGFLLAAAAAVALFVVGIAVATRDTGTTTVVSSTPDVVTEPVQSTVPDVVVPEPTVSVDVPQPTTPPASTPAPTLETTIPGTTGPETTVPDTTSPPTTVGAPAEPVVRPVGLAAWPPPSSAPGDLDDVPRLLPSRSGVDTFIRFEDASTGTNSVQRYLQSWYHRDGGAALLVRTRFQPNTTPDEFRTDVDASDWDTPWNEVFFSDAEEGLLILNLVADDGFVQLLSRGIGEEGTIDLARSLQRRPAPEPGWDVPVLSDAFVEFGESDEAEAAYRTIVWNDTTGERAELQASTDGAGNIEAIWWGPDATATVEDVNGQPAIVVTNAIVAITWRLTDGTFVKLGIDADVAAALEIARSVQLVGESTWLESTQLPPEGSDGCQGVFC